ncbi:hypothetical protein QR680_010874 [Steinernema hermaphroditum]|uniref:Uncharacterized protein n=1 Tax=Steinernema hermaphroditum TaxID=289476 RepID=A0AA39IRS6_9BILA|nr:hypothetical protein QR680_010874 [Steinernema hermaphroditum]
MEVEACGNLYYSNFAEPFSLHPENVAIFVALPAQGSCGSCSAAAGHLARLRIVWRHLSTSTFRFWPFPMIVHFCFILYVKNIW